MSDLFNSGIRPAIDQYLADEAEKVRDYGSYWSASSAGYCMRKNIFDRLLIPRAGDPTDEARKQRIFSAGHIFHKWAQDITKASGLSIAQELELTDDDLMIRGHIDDLVLVDTVEPVPLSMAPIPKKHLILYDYKTRNSKNFNYSKQPSYFHKMQTGTYMYMLKKMKEFTNWDDTKKNTPLSYDIKDLTEARVLNISKDDLRMSEVQYLWSDELKKEVVSYWVRLNGFWENKTLPPCTCHEQAGGFMSKEKWNPYYLDGEPCSIKHFQKFPELVQKWRSA